MATQVKVIIVVRGGIAEVLQCPARVTVEIRDYDSWEYWPANDPDGPGYKLEEIEGPVYTIEET